MFLIVFLDLYRVKNILMFLLIYSIDGSLYILLYRFVIRYLFIFSGYGTSSVLFVQVIDPGCGFIGNHCGIGLQFLFQLLNLGGQSLAGILKRLVFIQIYLFQVVSTVQHVLLVYYCIRCIIIWIHQLQLTKVDQFCLFWQKDSISLNIINPYKQKPIMLHILLIGLGVVLGDLMEVFFLSIHHQHINLFLLISHPRFQMRNDLILLFNCVLQVMQMLFQAYFVII